MVMGGRRSKEVIFEIKLFGSKGGKEGGEVKEGGVVGGEKEGGEGLGQGAEFGRGGEVEVSQIE